MDYTLDDIEIIKILAAKESTILDKELNDSMKTRLKLRTSQILREYYEENTMGIKIGWIEEFKKFGITEQDGKSAIACARRLGVKFE
jgi:hypothetical protein